MQKAVTFLFLFFLSGINLIAQAPCPSNSAPPSDNCSTACVFCNLAEISSSSNGYTADDATGFCGTIEDNQWIGFVANATSVNIAAISSNCLTGNGVQLAIYHDCASAPIACYGGCAGCGETPAVITTSDLVVGQQYFLMVDGYAGDQCDFTVNIIPNTGFIAPSIGPTGPISGPSYAPLGTTATYSVAPVAGAGTYIWDAPAGYLINGNPPPVAINDVSGNQVTVTMGVNSGSICVLPSNSCSVGTQVCKFLCPNGCTSLPPVTFCKGDSMVVCGTAYTTSGDYVAHCTSASGADSVVLFSLKVLNPVAKILADAHTFDCNHPVITLHSAPSAGTKSWIGPNSGAGDSLSVSGPGKYLLVVNDTENGVGCIATDTITINVDFSEPSIYIVGDTLKCHTPEVVLSSLVIPSNSTFHWTGPDGYTSTAPNPAVTAPGAYMVSVTGPNGCSSLALTHVYRFDSVPALGLSAEGLNCYNLFSTIYPNDSLQSVTYAWTGPGGFSATSDTAAIDLPGHYSLLITDTTSTCQSISTIDVPGDYHIPDVHISGDTIISCLANAAVLHGSSATPGAQVYWHWPDTTSTAPDLLVTVPGMYSLIVRGPNGCTNIKMQQVGIDTIKPILVIPGGGTLFCGDPVLLDAIYVSNFSIQWTGPNGFYTTSSPVLVYTTGTYTAVVTDPSNGCTSSGTAVVDGYNATPILVNLVQLTDDEEGTNGVGSINIDISGGILPYIVQWSHDGTFFSDSIDLTGLHYGYYTITVYDSIGCYLTATYFIDLIGATINPNETAFWDVFPNPATDVLNIRYKGDAKPDAQFKLFDATGRLMRVSDASGAKLTQLDIQTLPAGAYGLQIKTKTGTASRLVVIER
jgi:hypothetical protein